MSEQQDENKLIAERRAKLDGYREKAKVNNGSAFPNEFRRSDSSEALQLELGDKEKAENEREEAQYVLQNQYDEETPYGITPFEVSQHLYNSNNYSTFKNDKRM